MNTPRNPSEQPVRLMPEALVKVTDHGDFVSALYPNGVSRTLSWSELVRIEIQTNNLGPYGADFWWVLVGSRDVCEYPQGATGEEALVDKLRSFPGFADDAFAAAIRCTSNAEFVVWSRDDAA